MHASDRPTTLPSRLAVALRWAALAGLAWYAAFLWQHTFILPGGSDSSGYFNLARMLTEGRALTPIRPIDGVPPSALPQYAYSPLGFSPIGDGSVLTPTYPPGLPLILALFSS